MILPVATVLTVYGIETSLTELDHTNTMILTLQQYLPFTVLKRTLLKLSNLTTLILLQQYLPFTVLKPTKIILHDQDQSHSCVATVLTVYGIETILLSRLLVG